MKAHRYKCTGTFNLSPDHTDFVRRRVTPFLDAFGHDRPLIILLGEAYIQGIRDAADLTNPQPGNEGGING